MLKQENLIKLGLNKNEAKVYLSLIKFGESDANQIIKDTKFHKNIVYDNLDKLINKGLITYISDGKKRIFSISSSEMLVEHIDDGLTKLNEKREIAVEIAKEIKKRKRIIPQKQEAAIFRGKEGIRAYHKWTIKNNKPYSIFGAPKQSLEIMDEHFWKNFTAKRIEKKINVNMVFNPSLRSFSENLKNKYTQIKFFNRNFEPLTQTDVHEDKVAIIVWSETPLLFLIEDKEVAKSYKAYFNEMWSQGKK